MAAATDDDGGLENEWLLLSLFVGERAFFFLVVFYNAQVFILHIVLIILYIKLKSSNKNRDVLTFTYAPDQAYSSEEKLVTWLQTRNETMTNVI